MKRSIFIITCILSLNLFGQIDTIKTIYIYKTPSFSIIQDSILKINNIEYKKGSFDQVEKNLFVFQELKKQKGRRWRNKLDIELQNSDTNWMKLKERLLSNDTIDLDRQDIILIYQDVGLLKKKIDKKYSARATDELRIETVMSIYNKKGVVVRKRKNTKYKSMW